MWLWDLFTYVSDSALALRSCIPNCCGFKDSQDDTLSKYTTPRIVAKEAIRAVGSEMFEEHSVPNLFREGIMESVLERRGELRGESDGLLGSEEWRTIRMAELRVLFLYEITTWTSLGRHANFIAGQQLSFVSPLIMKLQFINTGDPANSKISNCNTLQYEAEVVKMCCELFRADSQLTTGYVATGGSESNMCAVRWARRQFPDAPFIAGENMHFTLKRAVSLVGGKLLEIGAGADGAISIQQLKLAVAACRADGVKAVNMLLVCGTTMFGAHDNIDAVTQVLDEVGYDREHRYVYVDSAYSGFVLPFLKNVDPGIRVDFSRQGLTSCSASLHKALGASGPSSIFLISKTVVDAEYHDYIRAADFTVSCSRDGRKAFEAWAMLVHILGQGRAQWCARWQQCVEMAAEFAARLERQGVEGVMHNESSVTVVFPKPLEYLVDKYQLACNGDLAEMIFNFHVLDGRASAIFLDEYLKWYPSRKASGADWWVGNTGV